MSVKEIYNRILQATTNPRFDRAVVSETKWSPVTGLAFNKINPPTYSGKNGPAYHLEERPDESGQLVKVAVIDSIQSQANRFEAAILAAYRRGEINIPNIDIVFEIPNKTISVNQLPHRVYATQIRLSKLNGVDFQETDFGKKVFSPRPEVYNHGLLQVNPLALIYGCWFSIKSNHARIARSVQSEIIGRVLAEGRKSASHFDPIVSKVVGRLARHPSNLNVLLLDEKEPVPDGYKEIEPSEAGLGNCTVASMENKEGYPLSGGVSVAWINQLFSVSFGSLQSYSTGRPEIDAKTRAMLTALALCGHTFALNDPAAGFLRSGCVLAAEETIYKMVNPSSPFQFQLTNEEAIELYDLAASEISDEYNPRLSLELRPNERLAKIMKNSISCLEPISKIEIQPKKKGKK